MQHFDQMNVISPSSDTALHLINPLQGLSHFELMGLSIRFNDKLCTNKLGLVFL